MEMFQQKDERPTFVITLFTDVIYLTQLGVQQPFNNDLDMTLSHLKFISEFCEISGFHSHDQKRQGMQSCRPLLRYELASEGQNRSPIGGQAL